MHRSVWNEPFQGDPTLDPFLTVTTTLLRTSVPDGHAQFLVCHLPTQKTVSTEISGSILVLLERLIISFMAIIKSQKPVDIML